VKKFGGQKARKKLRKKERPKASGLTTTWKNSESKGGSQTNEKRGNERKGKPGKKHSKKREKDFKGPARRGGKKEGIRGIEERGSKKPAGGRVKSPESNRKGKKI